jgi:hydrogenase maturation protein HypF
MVYGKKNTVLINIEGIVQGVGFRPFVYKLAREYKIKGYVRNDSNGVEIMAQASRDKIKEFINDLYEKKPGQAIIDELKVKEKSGEQRFTSFEIEQSVKKKSKNTRIAPDLCLCPDCREEMLNPQDRRYFYPFINCTNCGPRYTIVQDVPYDRKYTSMAEFKMCRECEQEYHDPTNRRFHAQPNACFACGPQLELLTAGHKSLIRGLNSDTSRELFQETAEFLNKGMILAIKGLGGFHLACDARNADAVNKLRSLKYREERPFALMAKNIESARKFCKISMPEEKRLQAVDRPIVLLEKASQHGIAEQVAPANRYFGIMLPYAPVHFLLFYFIDFPLVMTSGNLSDEPIAHTNFDALNRLSTLCDYFLIGNRDIHIRCDDSVIRVWRGSDYMLRRSRGITPHPLLFKTSFCRQILGVGGEQKNTVCLGKNNKAFLSHHIGDLKNAETYTSFIQAIGHLTRILDVFPQVLAYDLHPQYLSTQFVNNPPPELQHLRNLPSIGVQHHHAHLASCMAEHNLTQQVIGVVLDGSGLGNDGSIWGGEVLIADLKEAKRAGKLAPFLLPGGDKVIAQPWRTALSLLYQIYGRQVKKHLPPAWESISREELEVVFFQVAEQKHSPLTSSCGRLFDAVSALTGVCLKACYEGQPAVELEQAIEKKSTNEYSFEVYKKNNMYLFSWHRLIEQLLNDCRDGAGKGALASGFHKALVRALNQVVCLLAGETGIRSVVLSGGCFMNMYLLSELSSILEQEDLRVYTHRLVPCNDGGLALGQVVVADQLLKET